MKKSELLKIAKELISKTKHDREHHKRQPYICIAVRVAANLSNVGYNLDTVRDSIIADVMANIHPAFTMKSFYERMDMHFTDDELQVKRHELVDSLIEAYLEKGE